MQLVFDILLTALSIFVIGSHAVVGKGHFKSKSMPAGANLVSATVRVVFSTPVQTAKGAWMSSQTKATFDCTAKKLAAKENVYYGDAKETKVVDRTVNKMPGYGPALGGTMGALAMQYLCSTK